MNDLINRQDAIDAVDERIQTLLKDKAFRRKCGDRDLYGVKRLLQNLPSAQQWIPCSERLPENEDYVLVTTSIGDVTEAKYWHGEQLWVKNLTVLSVTAWMQLPQPWKGEA